MDGPPPFRKRKVQLAGWSAQRYTAVSYTHLDVYKRQPSGGGLDGRSGTYNLTSTGETTWFGFAKVLLTKSSGTFGFTVPSLIPIKTRDFPRPAKRPANSRLSCQRLEQTFGIRMPYWEHALSLVLDTLTEGSSSVSSKG